MRPTLKALAFAAPGFTAASLPAAAGTAHFLLRPITIAGASNVSASALNNHGVIVGNYTENGGAYAFILDGTALTILPPPCSSQSGGCVAFPSAINAAGTITGFSYYGLDLNAEGFIWQDGAYIAGDSFRVSNGVPAGPGPWLNSKGEVAFNYVSRDATVPYAGPPSAPQLVAVAGSFPSLHSINDFGVVAGEVLGTGHTAAPADFYGKSGHIAELLPPHAAEAYGGVVNNLEQVAGTYGLHGFVFRAGTYTSFDMPTAAKALAVAANNNRGRVAGIYTDAASNVQRVFLYNGSTVSAFGAYPISDTLRVAMNDLGVMVLSDFTQSGVTSWRVYCGGTGC